MEGGAEFGLLQLPREIIEKIFSFLTYDEISLCRATCRLVGGIASGCLNKGFSKADRLHSIIQREVKAKLPRRESERRNHPLARHVDILSAIETRLSLLSMTYSKYIDVGLCCFIPGKVLDEIFRVLRSVRANPNPPRAHELLQELRDISSMAMEHFDERIVPRIKSQMSPSSELRLVLSSQGASGSGAVGGTVTSMASVFKFRGTQAGQPTAVNDQTSHHHHRQKDYGELRKRLRQARTEMRRRLAERDAQIADMSRKITEQNHAVAELNRRVVDYDQRFNDIMAEFARIRSSEDAVGQSKSQAMSSPGTACLLKCSLPVESIIIKPDTVIAPATPFASAEPVHGFAGATSSVIRTRKIARKRNKLSRNPDVQRRGLECNTVGKIQKTVARKRKGDLLENEMAVNNKHRRYFLRKDRC